MRDSKNILHAKLGVSPMERQYGGGLDAAYMNRRRSSAFADPDATSAFASPMSMGGLPTIYREQGGPLPITSVYGQGIPRIVYRENGGDLDFGLSAEDMVAAYNEAGIDTSGFTDPGMTPEESDAKAGQYNPNINIPSRPTGISTEKNQATIQAEIARQDAIKAAREADRGTPPEATFGAGKIKDERDEVVDFWRNPNNILAIQARNNRIMEDVNRGRPSEEEYENYYSKLAREVADKQNREASKAGNLFPGFNILTGKPLTPPEQLRAALPFIPSQKDIKDEREFQEGKIWADKVNKEMKEDKEKEDLKEFNKHINRQADRITNSNLPPADKRAARNSLKDTINNYRIQDKGTVTEIVDSIVRGSEINRKTGGGLPTIYRQDGGDYFGEVSAEDMVAAYEDAGIDTSGFDTSLDGSVDYADPPQGFIVPTSDDKIDITEFPTDPNVGVFGRTLQTPAQIKSRLSGDKPEDGYTKVEYTYLNDIMDKNPGMTINQAQNYLASAMATPGGIAAMEKGFYSGYTGGGAAGTLKNFLDESITGTEKGLQKLLKDRKKEEEEKKEEKSVDRGSTLGSLLNYLEKGVSKLTGGKDLTSKDLDAMVEQAASRGDTFTPRSGLDKGIGAAISAIVPGANFIPQSVGVYRTKNGLEFNVSKDGSLSLAMPTPNIDYNELDEDTTSDKPEKKKKEIKEEEKKNYMKDYFSGLQSLDNTGDLKNFYERKSLEYVYPNKTSAEINAMINKP